jgi:hypothetical protein
MEMDKRAAALSEMHMAWPKFTKEQAALYDRKLMDIPDEILYRAVDALVNEMEFLPTIAEIRKRSRSLYSQAVGIISHDASEGWGEVVKAISHVGMNRFPEFSDPITAEVVRLMGWKDICLSPADSTSILRSQFLKMYAQRAERKTEEKKNMSILADGKVQKLIGNIGKGMNLPE